MSQTGETYKCNICGAVTKVEQGGAGNLACCNQDMELVSEENEE
jgi:desulfoferrodoxin-like iron-binding protein